MQKSGLKTGGHHPIFSVLEINRSKILAKYLFQNKNSCSSKSGQ